MIRQAEKKDLDAICEIYDDIHTMEETGKAVIGWIRDVYPTRATAEAALERGDLFVEEAGEQVVGTAIINRIQVDTYAKANWLYDAPDDQVMVLHTLIISPKASGRGFGRAFVEFYEDYARKNGCLYLRMDTNEKNAAARKMYQKLGYREADILPCVFNGIEGVQLVHLEKKLTKMNNYDKMSEAASRRFLTLDQEDMLRRVPLEHDEQSIYVTLLNDPYRVDRKTGYVYRLNTNSNLTDEKPEAPVRANMEETLSIFDMLDRSPHPPKAAGNWVSLTQLASRSGAGPVSFELFRKRLKPFEGHTEELAEACRQCGGTERKGGDVSFEIPVFDRFPLWFQYWDADEEFSASISILWDETTPSHLHYETVWYIMGLFLDKLNEKAFR